MHKTNFEGGFPAELAFDADIEFVCARCLEIRVNGKNRPEVSRQSIILRIGARNYHRRCGKSRCCSKTSVQAVGGKRRSQTSVSGNSVIRRTDELIAKKASPRAAAHDRA